MDRDRVLDENLYWLSNKPHSYEKMNNLEKTSVKTAINRTTDGHALIEISNQKNETAFFIRLKIMNSKNELVLPSYFTDNYFTLLPGDKKQVELDFASANIQGNTDGGLEYYT
jgi:deferrochelatase/peroxidase EfeB